MARQRPPAVSPRGPNIDALVSVEVRDRGAPVDWSYDCEGYPVIYDPETVTDAVFAELSERLAECRQWWDEETAPADPKSKKSPVRPFVDRRQMAVIEDLVNFGVAVRFTSGELTEAERRRVQTLARTERRLRNPQVHRITATGPRLGLTWTWMLAFPPRDRQRLFRPGYTAELPVPPGAYELLVYTGGFGTGRQSYHLVIQLRPAAPAEAAAPPRIERPAEHAIALEPALDCGVDALGWLTDLARAWVQTSTDAGKAARFSARLEATPARGRRRKTSGAEFRFSFDRRYLRFLRTGLDGLPADCPFALSFRFPAHPAPVEVTLQGTARAGRLRVGQLAWHGRAVPPEEVTRFRQAATWLVAEAPAYPVHAPNAGGRPTFQFRFSSADQAHRLAETLAERRHEIHWLRESLASPEPVTLLLSVLAEGVTPRAMEPVDSPRGAKDFRAFVKQQERLTAEQLRQLRAAGWDGLRRELDPEGSLTPLLVALQRRSALAPRRVPTRPQHCVLRGGTARLEPGGFQLHLGDPKLKAAFAALAPEQRRDALLAILAVLAGEPFVTNGRFVPFTVPEIAARPLPWRPVDGERLRRIVPHLPVVQPELVRTVLSLLDQAVAAGVMAGDTAADLAVPLLERRGVSWTVTDEQYRALARLEYLPAAFRWELVERGRLETIASFGRASARSLARLAGELRARLGPG